MSSQCSAKKERLGHTLVAGHFGLYGIADLATRREVGHVQVCRDTSRVQAARGYGQGSAEVDHAGNGAAMENGQSVLAHLLVEVHAARARRTVCSFWMSSSNLTRPGTADVMRSCGSYLAPIAKGCLHSAYGRNTNTIQQPSMGVLSAGCMYRAVRRSKVPWFQAGIGSE